MYSPWKVKVPINIYVHILIFQIIHKFLENQMTFINSEKSQKSSKILDIIVITVSNVKTNNVEDIPQEKKDKKKSRRQHRVIHSFYIDGDMDRYKPSCNHKYIY